VPSGSPEKIPAPLCVVVALPLVFFFLFLGRMPDGREIVTFARQLRQERLRRSSPPKIKVNWHRFVFEPLALSPLPFPLSGRLGELESSSFPFSPVKEVSCWSASRRSPAILSILRCGVVERSRIVLAGGPLAAFFFNAYFSTFLFLLMSSVPPFFFSFLRWFSSWQ